MYELHRWIEADDSETADKNQADARQYSMLFESSSPGRERFALLCWLESASVSDVMSTQRLCL